MRVADDPVVPRMGPRVSFAQSTAMAVMTEAPVYRGLHTVRVSARG